MREIDEFDDAVYGQGFLLASVVERFLKRRRVNQLLAFIDDPIVDELRDVSDEMGRLRRARLAAART